MSDDLVLVERDGDVVQLTLNRPEALNALSVALKRRLAEAFAELAQDESVAVIILTGAGRAFCVGLDLKELGGEISDENPLEMDDVDVAEAIASVRAPIIGAINGYAITGGFELALMCDILLGAQ